MLSRASSKKETPDNPITNSKGNLWAKLASGLHLASGRARASFGSSAPRASRSCFRNAIRVFFPRFNVGIAQTHEITAIKI